MQIRARAQKLTVLTSFGYLRKRIESNGMKQALFFSLSSSMTRGAGEGERLMVLINICESSDQRRMPLI